MQKQVFNLSKVKGKAPLLKIRRGVGVRSDKNAFTLTDIKELPSPLGKVARSAGRGNFEGDLKSSEQCISLSLEFVGSPQLTNKFFSLPRRDRRTAFTLAEVLITLGVIGVVAAMTLSVLTKKYNEQVIINRLKKDYSVFSQVITELSFEYDNNLSSLTDAEIYDEITKRIKVQEKCRGKKGCFSSPKYLSGSNAGDWKNQSMYKFIMNSGEYVYITGTTHHIYVDVNGEKLPNTIGRDIFRFDIMNGKLVPAGVATESDDCLHKTGWNPGYDCAYTVLKEGKFKY